MLLFGFSNFFRFRTTEEGSVNALKVDLTKTLLESLMEHVITHGGDVNREKAGTLLRLHRIHQYVAALPNGKVKSKCSHKSS